MGNCICGGGYIIPAGGGWNPCPGGGANCPGGPGMLLPGGPRGCMVEKTKGKYQRQLNGSRKQLRCEENLIDYCQLCHILPKLPQISQLIDKPKSPKGSKKHETIDGKVACFCIQNGHFSI